MQFLEHPPQGKFSFGRISLTIGLVILAYFVGSLFLFLDVFLNFQDHDYVIITMTDFADVMGKNRLFIWMLFPFVLVFATLIFATKYIHQIPIKSIFTTRDRFDWKRVFFKFGQKDALKISVAGRTLNNVGQIKSLPLGIYWFPDINGCDAFATRNVFVNYL